MKKNYVSQPKGLILLVVLGMLALFSLLAVTYVVFASQSRASSVALARHSIRESKNKNPLFEEAIKQLIRGTVDPNSAMIGNSLLGDLYGDFASAPGTLPILSIRQVQYNQSTGARSNMTYDASSGQRPMLLGGTVVGSTYVPGKFLRIPLLPHNGDYGPSTVLPNAHDALTGRIVTFPAGNGPLSGQSFRIVRYIGFVEPTASADEFMQCFSIVIDLSEADLSRTYSTRDAATGALITSTLDRWVSQYPPVTGVSSWAAGVYICYAGVDLNPASKRLFGGFSLFVNAAALNTHGIGVLNDGTSQMHVINPGGSATEPNLMPVSLQGRVSNLINPALGPFNSPSGTPIFPGATVLDPSTGAPTTSIVGDSDEPYDAADFNNWFLASRAETVSGSADIIPSFHRAALINYIVNWKDPVTYTEVEFLETLRRIQLATPRPLSLNVTTPSASIGANPTFTGSNAGNATGFALTASTPTLTLSVPTPWNTNWPLAVPTFRQWLNFLTVGPWDVDNDGDTIKDGVWVDLGMPLQSTADGKLLKALVSYYVDDLDSRIDVNAVGSAQQANMVGIFDRPTTFNTTAPTAFAKGQLQYINQGLGFGSADISFRHLFGKPYLRWKGISGLDAEELAYRDVMFSRYSRTLIPNEMFPGDTGDDAFSLPNIRERRIAFRHGVSPGLPMHVIGRASLGLDRLGNPFLHNVDTSMDESTNDPYESRLISAPHKDRPFSLSEWERIYRVSDSDRSALPSRVEELFGETSASIASSNLKQEITTISRNLRVPMLATRSLFSVPAPGSFFELVNTIRQLRGEPVFGYDQFGMLFPLEFHRGLPLDVNRPFGNGIDDNGNGEVDEPQELSGGQVAYYLNNTGGMGVAGTPEEYFHSTSAMNTGIRGTVDPVDTSIASLRTFPPVAPALPIYQGNETRQMFARHLYCLAQLIVPQDYVFPNVNRTYFLELQDVAQTGSGAAQAAAVAKLLEIRSRTLAQWAVNVVDFRDSDAVMTRFAYDNLPFDGTPWLPQPGNVVWGLEQPELLLTESFAMHDVRVKRDPMATPKRFDQYRTPQGSLFLELFCPRSTNTNASATPFTAANTTPLPGVPSSLYTVTGGDIFLDLGRLTPDFSSAGVAERFPVWRVYIGNSIDKSAATPALKTPNERLLDTSALTATSPTRNDVTYQLANSNLAFDSTGAPIQPLATVQNQSGLRLDRAVTVAEQLAEPDPDDARIILFARNPAGTGPFVPTITNTPGVTDPISQVFVNQSGAMALRGNQYLVVGPREKTFFGSRTTAKVSSPAPNNVPNNHRIVLGPTWVEMYMSDKSLIGQRPALRDCVTMIAGAELPTGWTGLPTTVDYIGVNVSEPLPKDTGYYAVPTQKLNSGDTTADAGETLEPGFNDLPFDAYHDYVTPAAPARAPFDNGASGPLENWDLNNDGTPETLIAANGVVSPGTELDWCTAYLQRLADPEKPWDATFNPYITVDWIPIDLTVFSGEDNETTNPELSGVTPKFASRQKVGQTFNAQTFVFNATAGGPTGQTFLSALTDTPQDSTQLPGSTTHFKFELAGDASSTRPSNPDGTGAFSTLGFLNSTFVLAAESGLAGLAPLPDIYQGAPGDPAGSNVQWHPDSLFWPNRPFVNALEVMNVPLSSPGQLTQEFSGTLFPAPNETKHSLYAAAYTNEVTSTFAQNDSRMPTAPIAAAPATPRKARVNANATFSSYAEFAPNVDNNNKDDFAFTPFTHLMNFFQESPELPTQSALAAPTDRHPKNTAMALLLDMMETASAWNDVSVVEPPAPLGLTPDPTIFAPEFQPLIRSNNVALATLRAPYNRISRFVEPGRINLNTVRQSSVFQGLWSNTLEPTDVDFPPYESPARPFGQVEDIDHNQNGIRDIGMRGKNGMGGATWNASTTYFAGDGVFYPVNQRFYRRLTNGTTSGTPDVDTANWVETAWSLVHTSRRGYIPQPGFFNPGGLTTNLKFNPNYPTEFAGIFKPSSEAGLVPKTRAPMLISPTLTAEETKFDRLATKDGVLDIFARQTPAHVTLLRGTTEVTGSSALIAGTGVPYFGNAPLLQDVSLAQRQAFTDRYPITRLANLVSNRSNVFAVYVTIGLFEYDEASGALGIEYGADKGEVERFKAFYVIDRTVPVGYRTGEDHNIEKTILVRRYLNN